ncbi:MAG: SPFH domain-containing protein, partial [Actinomyces sp.]
MGVSLIGLIAVVAIIVLAAVAYLFSRIVVVPSNLTGLISGSNRGTVKIVHPGGRDFVLPVIQTIQYLPFTQTTIGFKVTAEDENKINVNVAAVAAVKVGDSDEQVRAAAKRFLGKPNTDQAIADSAREALIGSLRSIIGHMTVTDLISDRDALQRNVFDDAKSIMANMGLEIDMLQVSEITDAGGYIESLGVPEQQRVEKDARIARANAEREARDAEVTSRQQIAERERDLSLRQAQLKAETDKAQADADSAGPIARAAKEREIAIIGQEAAEAKAALTERELDSTVRKPADAARYQREQEAQASKTEALLRAQADAERTRLDAEAQAQATVARAEAEAKATAARYQREQEAQASKTE